MPAVYIRACKKLQAEGVCSCAAKPGSCAYVLSTEIDYLRRIVYADIATRASPQSQRTKDLCFGTKAIACWTVFSLVILPRWPFIAPIHGLMYPSILEPLCKIDYNTGQRWYEIQEIPLTRRQRPTERRPAQTGNMLRRRDCTWTTHRLLDSAGVFDSLDPHTRSSDRLIDGKERYRTSTTSQQDHGYGRRKLL